jgi:hypothetical protein
MESDHPTNNPLQVAPSELLDSQRAASSQAIRIEQEATDCSSPAAIDDWCRRAHAFLDLHLQTHPSARIHEGDSVCQIIARATFDRARRVPDCPVDVVHLLGPQPKVPPWLSGNAALGNLLRLAYCCAPKPHPNESPPPPLSETEQHVLDVIRAQPPGKCITGPQIVAALAKLRFPLALSTLTRHTIPTLKKHYGVRNRRGVGYYIEHRPSA